MPTFRLPLSRRAATPALLAAALVLGAASPRTAPHPPAGTPVMLQDQHGSALDAAARQLVADDLADARAARDRPIVLVASANLGGERPALFVQLQSRRECGSAGCTTSVYEWQRGAWQRVLDGTTGKLSVATRRTKGHFDLLTDDDHYIWTGIAYRSVRPAPALDLRPRQRRR